VRGLIWRISAACSIVYIVLSIVFTNLQTGYSPQSGDNRFTVVKRW
jgi:hypothetical protein